MTDREREQIEFYIPSPPDLELDFMDFYMMDSADRVIKVHACSVAADDDGEMLEVFRLRDGRISNVGVYNAMGEVSRLPGWYYKWALYDNKQDCRNNTHFLYNHWEALRDLQRKENQK